MTCKYPYTDCKCFERMGNDFWFLPVERCLYERERAMGVEVFCSLGADCICNDARGKPDPECKHYRRTSHGSEVPLEKEIAA